MSTPENFDDLVVHPTVLNSLTLESLAGVAEMPVELVQMFVEHGLIEPMAPRAGTATLWFEASCVTRLRTIYRLRSDLGINLPGIAAVLDLLDRVQALQRELDLHRTQRL